ncbi:MAG: hypothetical protein ACT4NY_17380 [Pseudonocardiales bacterium]
MIEGILIAESLREGTSLDGLRLVVRKLSRWTISDTAEYQPNVWTIIQFSGDDLDPNMLAKQFADALDTPSWYVDFHTTETKYVVFPGKVFRYPRGDTGRRAEVVAYAKMVGVPDTQLDWSD